MKVVYRILILLLVFGGSLYFFGSRMTTQVYLQEEQLMEMSEVSLPYLYLRVENQNINLLRGYASSIEPAAMRESMTPLSKEQTFSVVITENESVVKKVKYELLSAFGDNLIEEGAVTALDKEEGNKLARIKLKETLSEDEEYIVKLTLITDQSKRIYFYTRAKVLSNGSVKEKIDFVEFFHTSILSKDTAHEVERYLETDRSHDNSSYAYVSLLSTLDMVSYGSLDKSVVFEQIPTITEISKEQISITKNFVLTVNTPSGPETHRVKEYYRFGYTNTRIYLYNYERFTETDFDIAHTSLAKEEFKLGVTNQTEIDFVTNLDNSMVSFLYNRTLYFYSHSENKLVQVFSFLQKENTDYIRDSYDHHNLKIISMDDSGNITFMVYGYMNRGEYEGRVAIILYSYDQVLGQIEEKIYIPINTTYEELKEEIGDFAFRNSIDVIYFTAYDTVFSYNLSTESLKKIAEHVPASNIVYSKKHQYLAWQSKEDVQQDSIHILQLETGNSSTIYAGSGERIYLLGSIDDNIIYGLGNKKDETVNADGTRYRPMYRIVISDYEGSLLKDYEKEGIYTIEARIDENVIELRQAVKSEKTVLGYEPKESDFILNKATKLTQPFHISKRVTDQMLTEYYISLNQNYTMEAYPLFEYTSNKVITEDTTVRIPLLEKPFRYYVYSFGRIRLKSIQLGDAIRSADEQVGLVIDENGKKLWERGAKLNKNQINGVPVMFTKEGQDSIQTSLKILLAYKNAGSSMQGYDKRITTIEEYLSSSMNAMVLRLNSITLDEALYYVSKGKPVLAFKSENKAVVIVGYDSTAITVIDPLAQRVYTLPIKDAEEQFTGAGNIYYSYMD